MDKPNSPYVVESRHMGKVVLPPRSSSSSPNPDRIESGDDHSESDLKYQNYLMKVEAKIKQDKLRLEKAEQDRMAAKAQIARDVTSANESQQQLKSADELLIKAQDAWKEGEEKVRTLKDRLDQEEKGPGVQLRGQQLKLRQERQDEERIRLKEEMEKHEINIDRLESHICKIEATITDFRTQLNHYKTSIRTVLQQEENAAVTATVLGRQARKVDPIIKLRSYYEYLIRTTNSKDPFNMLVQERAAYQMAEGKEVRKEFLAKKRFDELAISSSSKGVPFSLSTSAAGPAAGGNSVAHEWTWDEKNFMSEE